MERITWVKSKDDQLTLLTNEEEAQPTVIEMTDEQQITEEPPNEIRVIDAQQVTEEPMPEIEMIDEQHLSEQASTEVTEPPPLTEGELYHVFLSYSSSDSKWTESLMEKLESRGLKVCCHLRDFTAGRSILENMSECIAQSQKVLLVLTPEFVNSRWCLLEANMSLFQDSLQRKTIVPVLLRPVAIPLYLAPLTYLEPQRPDFVTQLFTELCKPNRNHHGSPTVPFQPSPVYNGKILAPLLAVNEETLNKYDFGEWSKELPEQLQQIIQEPERYIQAIDSINKLKKQARFRSVCVRKLYVFAAVIVSLIVLFMYLDVSYSLLTPKTISIVIGSNVFFILTLVLIWFFRKLYTCKPREARRIVRKLQKAVGRANCKLSEENILVGCVTNSKLYLVYVYLDGCKRELTPCLPFHKALLRFSSGYACCLAKRHFTFTPPTQSAHLERGVCFCQYVLHHLNEESFYKRLKERCIDFLWR